jgi:hypothetical protein
MKALQQKYACVPTSLETPKGHIIWYNPLEKLLALEVGIPEVWNKLQCELVESKSYTELYHSDKWRKYAKELDVGEDPDRKHGLISILTVSLFDTF